MLNLKGLLKEKTQTLQKENRNDCHLGEVQQRPQKATLKMKLEMLAKDDRKWDLNFL
jgi:hypothetical protein